MASDRVIFMIETPKTGQKIREFFEAFGKLSGDEKVNFLAQIDKVLAAQNEKDKKIFLSLIKAAKDGVSSEDAIREMEK